MNKEGLLEAIDLLIAKYQKGVEDGFTLSGVMSCPLCSLFYNFIGPSNLHGCIGCPNKVFFKESNYSMPCVSRGRDYHLDYILPSNYKNLVKFWISMKELFLATDNGSDMDLLDDQILSIAEPYLRKNTKRSF